MLRHDSRQCLPQCVMRRILLLLRDRRQPGRIYSVRVQGEAAQHVFVACQTLVAFADVTGCTKRSCQVIAGRNSGR